MVYAMRFTHSYGHISWGYFPSKLFYMYMYMYRYPFLLVLFVLAHIALTNSSAQ